jgi:hypothetical protein
VSDFLIRKIAQIESILESLALEVESQSKDVDEILELYEKTVS